MECRWQSIAEGKVKNSQLCENLKDTLKHHRIKRYNRKLILKYTPNVMRFSKGSAQKESYSSKHLYLKRSRISNQQPNFTP